MKTIHWLLILTVISSLPHSAILAAEVLEITTGTTLGYSGDMNSLNQENLNRSLRQEILSAGRISKINAFIKAGANVNAPAEYGETALYYAVLFGRVKATQRLLELGADPNITNETNKTPLHQAAESCNDRLVESLLKAGASPTAEDYCGRTPLHLSIASNCVRATAFLLQKEKEKINLDAQDCHFRTAQDYVQHPWIQSMLSAARELSKPHTPEAKPTALP